MTKKAIINRWALRGLFAVAGATYLAVMLAAWPESVVAGVLLAAFGALRLLSSCGVTNEHRTRTQRRTYHHARPVTD